MSNIRLRSDEDLILLHVKADDRRQVIEALGRRVEAKGYINERFIPRLLEREEAFPTGIETAYPIAIPHIGGDCTQPFLAVAVLDEPVMFGDMGGVKSELAVRLVFLFGITAPEDQVQVLKNFMAAFTMREHLESLLGIESEIAGLELLETLLGDGFEAVYR
ncbi:MAG: PTS sugar transporter subunit IIA [Clostridiales Family XIII bacterium]|jgi:PTS system galactitol-specific IIA component|nr:PTS sugar transporter subunit IIA [Clostridiales Family XIII bacterium]